MGQKNKENDFKSDLKFQTMNQNDLKFNAKNTFRSWKANFARHKLNKRSHLNDDLIQTDPNIRYRLCNDEDSFHIGFHPEGNDEEEENFSKRPLKSSKGVTPQSSESTHSSSPSIKEDASFSMTTEELCNLVDPKNVKLLEEWGGVARLCEKLSVNPKCGLETIERSSKTPSPTLQKKLSKVHSIDTTSTSTNSSNLSQSKYSKVSIQQRQNYFGKNVLPERCSQSFTSLVLQALSDKTLILLSTAAVISLAVGIWEDFNGSKEPNDPRLGWVEGVTIIVAVV